MLMQQQQSRENLLRRRQLAEQLMSGSQSTQRPTNWMSGLAGLIGSVGGAYIGKKAEKEMSSNEVDRNNAMKDLVAGGTREDLIKALAGNPETSNKALEMKLAEIERASQSEIYNKRQEDEFNRKKALIDYQSANTKTSRQRDYDITKGMSDDERNLFFRGTGGITSHDLGNERIWQDASGNIIKRMPINLKPADQPENVRDKSFAAKQGASQAEFSQLLPSARTATERTVNIIDQLIGHGGRADATGMSSFFNKFAFHGTDRKDFMAKLEQATGNAFLQAREALKGGGPITDFESGKAESAYAQMMVAQSEEQFMQALNEFRYWAETGYRTLQEQAGVKGDDLYKVTTPNPYGEGAFRIQSGASSGGQPGSNYQAQQGMVAPAQGQGGGRNYVWGSGR